MNDTCFDLLVIGGGASGACVAYEGVRRGLRVALLEGHDLGVQSVELRAWNRVIG